MRRLPPEPIREALVRPNLWLGCDPVLLIALGTLCGLVGVGGGIGYRDPMLILVAMLLFSVGRWGLLQMAQKDPQMRAVFLRRAGQPSVFDARPRWDSPPRRARSWS